MTRRKVDVGAVLTTAYWGDVEVLERVSKGRVKVKFLRTGNLKECRTRDLRRDGGGLVKDTEAAKAGIPPVKEIYNPARGKGALRVGDRYPTTLYGDVEIVEYNSSTNVLVRFVDTGNTYTVQKDNLVKGLVQDRSLRSERSAVARDADIAAYNQRSADRLEAVIRKWIAKSLTQRELSRKRAESLARKQEALHMASGLSSGDIRTDKLGFKYELLHRVGASKVWMVKYVDTGHEYRVKEALVLRGSCFDRLHVDFKAIYKDYQSKLAKTYYDNNRDEIKCKASEYQKRNLGKARVRNFNRRSKLKVHGSHTYEETMKLLYDQDGKCPCCGISLEYGKHLDHIMPLALGGSNNIDNLQWLCPTCNYMKSDRHPDDWARYILTDEFKRRIASRRAEI